jgi:hypothetical protein
MLDFNQYWYVQHHGEIGIRKHRDHLQHIQAVR